MDAVEYNMALYRMCQSNDFSCNMCEFNKLCGIKNSGSTLEDAKKAVEFVKQWAEDHPFKTRQSEFLKLFPNAVIDEDDGILCINPCTIDGSIGCTDGKGCGGCRRKYWLTEVTDNGND